MVTIITRDNIDTIKNKGLRKDVQYYLDIYDSFLEELTDRGMSLSEDDFSAERQELVAELEKLGVQVRNTGKSFLWGNISPSCEDCRTGEGSSTFIVSLRCNRDCFFCVNKNQYDYSVNNNTKVYPIIEQFNKANKRYGTMYSAAITGGEPLLFVDECVDFLKHVKKRNKKTQTRIYTNGDLASEDVLKTLAKAGLDEIRFGLKPDDDGVVAEEVLKNLENAVKYIPRAMVEMPVEPGRLESMKKLADRLEKIGVYSINILEFLFPWVHEEEYVAKGYKIKKRPYHVLFDYTYAGGLPVAGSENECLKLLKYMAENQFKMGGHYCSLENKLTAQIWHHNHSFKKAPVEYFSENDFFVKVAKAYGEDAGLVKEILDQKGASGYSYNAPESIIEFSVKDIHHLKKENVELGISSLILDIDEDKTCVREIAVHVAHSGSFSINDL